MRVINKTSCYIVFNYFSHLSCYLCLHEKADNLMKVHVISIVGAIICQSILVINGLFKFQCIIFFALSTDCCLDSSGTFVEKTRGQQDFNSSQMLISQVCFGGVTSWWCHPGNGCHHTRKQRLFAGHLGWYFLATDSS